MKAKHILLTMILWATAGLCHSQEIGNDTVDILDYQLTLDIGHKSQQQIEGQAQITMTIEKNTDRIVLDLLRSTIDSVLVDGQPTDSYTYDDSHLEIAITERHPGDTLTATVFYTSNGYVESQRFGGFHFDDNIYYNLGIAFADYPNSMGRAWFPCKDNFYDKATYHIEVTAPIGWTAQCGGIQDTLWTNTDSSQTSVWTVAQPVPTYLVSVAVAPFRTIHRSYESTYGTYPATLSFLGHDSTLVHCTFDNMGKVIPMYEQCFGPYRWGRIGYISTPRGSMEHVNNIALATDAMANTEESAQSTIAHEFSHSWFGNLITCATPEDMWFNEGGASFCEEVAMEAIYADSNPGYSQEYYEKNLESVLRTCHVNDGDYYAVYGLPHSKTYGSTVYNKGALVWHSLRGYMGDSLFYDALKRLFDRNEYGNINSEQLRDSLELYSGKDLHDFFRFHVFSPGFVDYAIDSMTIDNGSTWVYVRQKQVGTDSIVRQNKVDITYFDENLESEKLTFEYEGTNAILVTTLPFEPVYAVVNYDKKIATAATGGDIDIHGIGEYEYPLAHFLTNVRQVTDTLHTRLHVTHHWSHPDPSEDQGFVRMSRRYWTVTGHLPSGTKLSGMFQYTCDGAANAEYPSLDYGFYDTPTSYDSLRLVYREDCSRPWRVISNMREGNSREGYFKILTLKTGEYALAIIDTARLGIPDIAGDPFDSKITVSPNPSNGIIHIDGKSNTGYTIDIVDLTGHLVAKSLYLANGETLRLKHGTYLLVIKANGSKETIVKKVVIR